MHTVPTIDQVIEAAISSGDRPEIQSMYQGILDSKAAGFDAYVGADRPQFEFTEDPNIGTAAFFVDPKGKPRIQISIDYVIDNRLSAEDIEALAMHELTHFMDRANNSEGYDNRFKKFEVMATDMADKIATYFEQKYKRVMPAIRKSQCIEYLYKIYDGGYGNVIDDVYVNHNVVRFKPELRPIFENMYRKSLSKSRDLSMASEFYQYVSFMLRGENVPEGMRITEGAQEALARDYNLKYKRYDVSRGTTIKATAQMDTQQVIDTFLNPNTENRLDHGKKGNTTLDKDTSLAYRSEYVDATLLPTFTELLFKDMCKQIDQYVESGMADKDKDIDNMMEKMWEEISKWMEQIIKGIEASSPDIIPKGEIKKYADWKNGRVGVKPTPNVGKPPMTLEEIKALHDAAEAKARVDKEARESAERQSSEERQRVARENAVAEFAKAKNIKEETAKRVAAAWHDVAPYIGALDDVWRRIVGRYGNEHRSVITGRHSSGTGVDVDAVINQLPDLLGGHPERFRPFTRVRSVEAPSERPERIKVRLLIDQSSSMQGAKSSKNQMIDRLLTMMYMSQDNFNTRLSSNKDNTGSAMHMDTQTIVYGDVDKTRVVDGAEFLYTHTGIDGAGNDIRSGVKGEKNYKALESVGVDMGYTYDDKALDIVLKSIDTKEKQKIKDGKVLDIAILITDGASSDWIKAKEKVDALIADGVTVFAFQIGEVGAEETKVFNKVWNQNVDGKIRGVTMGSDFTKLPAVLTQMLIDVLGDIEI